MFEAGRRVQVCDDAVFMVFARRAAGQAAGHPFVNPFRLDRYALWLLSQPKWLAAMALWSEQRNERKKSFLF